MCLKAETILLQHTLYQFPAYVRGKSIKKCFLKKQGFHKGFSFGKVHIIDNPG